MSRTGPALDTDGQGVFLLIGFAVGGGDEECSPQGPRLLFLGPVRAQKPDPRRFAAGDPLEGVREHFSQWGQWSWALVFRQRSAGHFLWGIAPLAAPVGRVGCQPLNILKSFGPRLHSASVVLPGRRAQLGVELSYPAGGVFQGLFEGAPSRVEDLHGARNLFAALDRKSTRLNSSHANISY